MKAASKQGGARVAIALGVLFLALALAPRPAAAHCDSLDGPVVVAAQAALDAGDVTGVLKWVRPADEPEIRAAFERTLRVRSGAGAARELADRWFFETLVRVHRAGEGAAYTGLKEAGAASETGIAEADASLAAGSPDALADAAAAHVAAAIRERHEQVQALARHDPADVEAGRRYVAAYVEYIHFVERLHAFLGGGGRAQPASGHGH